ncbi:MAG: hypothetical protein HQL07_04600 [Nitrospirae bacterium]|nr:hypothetical protein [Magnetococcales bacterium]HAT50769.1 hypothetical protein [Alphaproteobacteria bacterium]
MDNGESKVPSLAGVLAPLAVFPVMLLATILGFFWGCIRLAFNDGGLTADRMVARASLKGRSDAGR